MNGPNRENMDVHSEIIVHLPKFKLEEEYELNEPLSKLGMTDVFCASKADLSGMNGEGRTLPVYRGPQGLRGGERGGHGGGGGHSRHDKFLYVEGGTLHSRPPLPLLHQAQ